MRQKKVQVTILSGLPLASYYFNWDSVLREEYEKKDDGVWLSVGVFEADDPNDKIAKSVLERYTERLLLKHEIGFKVSSVVLSMKNRYGKVESF